jgi:2-keto-4-pentenoate hydratase
MPRCGWKVGINVPEIQKRLALPHAGIGWLDGDQLLRSESVLTASSGARLHVEPEVALRISGRVPEAIPASRARCHIAAVHPALEIVNYAKPGSGLTDVVAHSMFHEATVLGDAVSLEAVPELGSSWPVLMVDDRPGTPPRSDLVPAELGELVAFAAAYLAAFGQILEDGDLLLSGAFLDRAPGISPGGSAVAEFGPMGSVAARVAAQRAGEPAVK